MGHYFGQLMDMKVTVSTETQHGFILLAEMLTSH
jgi:hypothetical protein